jgi:hypothetical protein
VRHPLSTSGGLHAGVVAVRCVDGLVVVDVKVQAVPEDFEPAVAELAQCGVVMVAGGDLCVVGLAGRAERDRLQKAGCWTASPRWRLQARRRARVNSLRPDLWVPITYAIRRVFMNTPPTRWCPESRSGASRPAAPAAPGPATSAPHAPAAAAAARQRDDGAASRSWRPSTSPPGATAEQRHDTGYDQEDQLQAHKPKIIPPPDGPGPARPAPKRGMEPTAICRASAQVTQVFGTHSTAGSASGPGKRTRSNPGTAPQADSITGDVVLNTSRERLPSLYDGHLDQDFLGAGVSEQTRHREPAHPLMGKRDCCQSRLEVTRDLVVVEADDRQVFGHGQVELGCC